MNKGFTFSCAAAVLALTAPALAQGQPTPGGNLTIAMRSAPATFDCHAIQGYSALQTIAPAFSTLVKYERGKYPNIVGDVAKSFAMSPDGLTYTFELHPDVKFHDGSVLTSEDVKATFERIRNPPQGVTVLRQTQFAGVESITATGPLTIAFKQKSPNPAILTAFADPHACIYSAKQLGRDQTAPAREALGTGPFKFVRYDTGSLVVYEKFDGYFRKGLPYLDRVEYVLASRNGLVPALAGGQIDADFFTLGAPLQAQVQRGRGDSIKFPSSATTVSPHFIFNVSKAPFDDVRVRRALTMAVDRPLGAESLAKIIGIKGYMPPIFRPESPYSLKPDQVNQLPGYGADIQKSRAEARRLLAEAGQSNLKFELLAVNSADPFEAVAVYLIDAWRQIGVTVTKQSGDLGAVLAKFSSGDFQAAIDWNSPISQDPTEVLAKHAPGSPSNFTRQADPELDRLYKQIQVEVDEGKRRAAAEAFQLRLIDQGYTGPTFWADRTTALPAKLQGWITPPNFSLWLDLADIWLQK